MKKELGGGQKIQSKENGHQWEQKNRYTGHGYLTTLPWKSFYFCCWVGKITWRRERLPTPAFWPREFHGLYSPWGCKELNTTEWLAYGSPPQHSCLENPMDGGAWQATVHAAAKRRTRLLFHFHHLLSDLTLDCQFYPPSSARHWKLGKCMAGTWLYAALFVLLLKYFFTDSVEDFPLGRTNFLLQIMCRGFALMTTSELLTQYESPNQRLCN